MLQTLYTRTLLFFGILLFNSFVIGQPSNDNCANAFGLEIAADEASCNLIAATTVGATPSSQPVNVCSGTDFADDVWFSFTTEAVVPEGAVVIRCYFSEPFVDVPSVGMAVYKSCSFSAVPIDCFSDTDPERNRIVIFSGSLLPNQTYYVRVWSTPGMIENSGTFRICAYWEAPSEDVVLWGNNPGEGDFDGGMNGWTTIAIDPDDSAKWRWAACACSAGELDHSKLSSPSAYNGAMIFDADSLNCCLSDDPPPLIVQQTGELWSPVIDCSSFPAVALKYYQSYAAVTSTTSIAYSIDGGVTWLDTIEVNKEIGPSQKTYSPSFHRIPILEAAGASQFRVKFIFSGNFYNWIVDDVQLVSLENNNLDLAERSVAIAPNARWPVSQLECFGFKGDISNLGATAQPDVDFNISIFNETTSDQVYNETLPLGTIPALTTIENQIIEGCFTPSVTPTPYSGIYTVSSDSIDSNPETNVAEFGFETTEFQFSKERGATTTIHPGFFSWDSGEPHSWAYGNFFHIVKGSETEPKIYAYSGTFSIGNADGNNVAGQMVSLFLYKWDDDTNNDGNMDPDERTKVAYRHYTILGTEQPLDLITLPLVSYPDGDPENQESIFLESNQDYVLMLEYSATSNIDIEFLASTAFDYNAQIELSQQNGNPRFAGMLGVNGDLDAVAYNSTGFGRDVVPVVRLHLTDQQVVKTENIISQDLILSLSPNPVNDYLRLNTNLTETLPEATIRIFDLNGRLLVNQNYQNLSSETLSFDVSRFTPGAYVLQFISNNTVKAGRFLVQH